MRSWPFFLLPVAVALAAAPFIPSPGGDAAETVAAQTRPWTNHERRGGALPGTEPVTSGTGSTLQQVYEAAAPGAARVNIGTSGTGSGFFLTADGLLLTAAHVALAGPGEDLTVTTGDGRTRPAQLVGYDEVRDVALLRVQGTNFQVLPLATSTPGVGDGVVAIGNSRGDFGAGRAGRVTTLSATLGAAFPSGLVASSMPLAPGDSGGPVLNDRGEVVGLSDAVGQGEQEFSSYFVPLTASSPLVADLRAGVRRGVPVLGVNVVDAGRALGTSGALVTGVTPGLGAEAAWVRPANVRPVQDELGRTSHEVTSADVIVAVDGQRVDTPDDLVGYLRGKHAGDRVTLQVMRDGSLERVTVSLSDKRAA